MYSTWFSRYWTLGKRRQETNEEIESRVLTDQGSQNL